MLSVIRKFPISSCSSTRLKTRNGEGFALTWRSYRAASCGSSYALIQPFLFRPQRICGFGGAQTGHIVLLLVSRLSDCLLMTIAHCWNSERLAALWTNQERSFSVSEDWIGSVTSQTPFGARESMTVAGAEKDSKVMFALRQSVLPKETLAAGCRLAQVIGQVGSYAAKHAAWDLVQFR